MKLQLKGNAISMTKSGDFVQMWLAARSFQRAKFLTLLILTCCVLVPLSFRFYRVGHKFPYILYFFCFPDI